MAGYNDLWRKISVTANTFINMKFIKEKIGIILIFLFAMISLVVLTQMDPIPQEPSYHKFSDNRSFSGIPNA